jgi:hypothetical protein
MHETQVMPPRTPPVPVRAYYKGLVPALAVRVATAGHIQRSTALLMNLPRDLDSQTQIRLTASKRRPGRSVAPRGALPAAA